MLLTLAMASSTRCYQSCGACPLILKLYPQGRVPDFILRPVIRALCRQRLREIDHGSFEENFAAKMKWIEGVRARTAIADVPEKANEQHYEVRPSN